ncbi:hypothetical protein M3G03_09945 [Aestuariimicrobium sp. p3-SID1156]|uniref:hypothetical protein n=1 Tax=Aestuariimicrobium sp. p3-SID1156 TaxID=2916038 RepID=UPI00223A743D|nr:hypothetical protein [Aestuariimicrobium sp. p3-SID1156]MCT1459851.1 hypothetical protein [Aestuariimicrobium sp. p3-SID1156]
MAFYTAETNAQGRLLTAGTIAHVKELANSTLPTPVAGKVLGATSTGLAWVDAPTGTGGGSGSDALIRITGNTTPAAGTTAGQLAGYRNTSASAITVAGFSVAAGAGIILEWTGSAWAKAADLAALATGGTTPPADTTAPTAGTLSVTPAATSAVLSVAGASDAGGLHAAPYAFSTNSGGVWSAWQAASSYTATGLTPSTSYGFRHKVRDAAGNESQGAIVTASTTAAPADSTPPTAGTLAASAVTQTGFTLTISGASDAGGLAAAPYAFSTDNGATWTAFQASASHAVTGKTAGTAYTCRARVKDAAGNTADTAAITVTTTAATTLTRKLYDTFTRADGALLGSAADTGQTWGGSVTAKVVSQQMQPGSGAGESTISHGVTAGDMDLLFTVTLPASTDSSVEVRPKNVTLAKNNGHGVYINRGASKTYVALNQPGGNTPIPVTFNNGNGSTTNSPWAFVPGAQDYSTAATVAVKVSFRATTGTMTAYIDGTRVLEGTYTDPASAPNLAVYSSSTSVRIDNLEVLA